MQGGWSEKFKYFFRGERLVLAPHLPWPERTKCEAGKLRSN